MVEERLRVSTESATPDDPVVPEHPWRIPDLPLPQHLANCSRGFDRPTGPTAHRLSSQ